MSLSHNEALKEIRANAKKNGLTFKRKDANYYKSPLYKFVDRESGYTVLDNQTLGRAYDNVCSGYIDEIGRERESVGGLLDRGID